MVDSYDQVFPPKDEPDGKKEKEKRPAVGHLVQFSQAKRLAFLDKDDPSLDLLRHCGITALSIEKYAELRYQGHRDELSQVRRTRANCNGQSRASDAGNARKDSTPAGQLARAKGENATTAWKPVGWMQRRFQVFCTVPVVVDGEDEHTHVKLTRAEWAALGKWWRIEAVDVLNAYTDLPTPRDLYGDLIFDHKAANPDTKLFLGAINEALEPDNSWSAVPGNLEDLAALVHLNAARASVPATSGLAALDALQDANAAPACVGRSPSPVAPSSPTPQPADPEKAAVAPRSLAMPAAQPSPEPVAALPPPATKSNKGGAEKRRQGQQNKSAACDNAGGENTGGPAAKRVRTVKGATKNGKSPEQHPAASTSRASRKVGLPLKLRQDQHGSDLAAVTSKANACLGTRGRTAQQKAPKLSATCTHSDDFFNDENVDK